MNWLAIKNINDVQVGSFLALMIVAVMPNFGLKHGASPALPAVLLALLGLWLLWKQGARLFAAPSIRRLTLVFLLLLVPVLISVPTSYDPNSSLSVAGALVAYFFAGVAMVQVLRGDAQRAWLIKWVTIVMTVWVLDSLVQYIFGVDLFGITVTPDARVLGPFKDSLRQPILLALLMPLALWALLRRGMAAALVFFAAAGFVSLLSGVRMVLVMLAIVAVGLYIKLPSWRFKIPAALLALAIALTAMGLTPTMQERMGRLTQARDLKFETVDHMLSTRATIWETATHMLFAHPLTGIGAGAFNTAYVNYSTRPTDIYRDGKVKVYHAHQVYFSAAAETGWPGLLGLVAALGLCVIWYRRAPATRRAQAWPFGLGLVVYFFPLNTQPPMYHGNWLFPILLLIFAALLAALDGDVPTASPENAVERG